MARKLLGFVLIHSEKEDFVVGSNNNEMMNAVIITTLRIIELVFIPIGIFR